MLFSVGAAATSESDGLPVIYNFLLLPGQRLHQTSGERYMPTDIIMPQMGESIFEGTITKWLKKPGEAIQRDEPLFEISTDKVDAEIPAPTSGVLKEIKVAEGTTVQVNTVVGVIDEAGAAAATAPQPAKAATQPTPSTASAGEPTPKPALAQTAPAKPPTREGAPTTSTAEQAPSAAPRAAEEETETPTYLRDREAVESEARPRQREAVARHPETVIEFPKEEEGEEGERIRSSPLVRRLAREHQVDLHQVTGTGLGGRITKDDIQRFIEQHPAGAPSAPPARPAVAAQAPAAPAAQAPAYQTGAVAPAMPVAQPTPAGPIPAPGEIVPMSPMRKKIAERMVESKRTSAHVHSVYEVDMTRIVKLRDRLKNDFEGRTGSKLTFMPFFCRAAIHGIRQFPIINSSVEGDNIHYHRNVNLGIAVALDWGLIVPVVKNAEEKNFLGLQRTITDLAERARAKKLLPDEVAGGTFSITNPGNYGQMFGLPIIMQPQVAIMGIGNIKKQPVVLTDENGMDSIAIRSMCHISLGYDHRVIDGAIADQFLREVAGYLQNWNEDLG
jgi:pyruvate dehydrogenase E2 component (dihydrolipoamide acetyltransferase)